ncbi:MAG: hypothetical protein CM15mP74_21920 [Halieaceae bacterium]|nr:MAG: hypothetical protein CM15mP74_21920 [Halieaceae bacterium]
MAQDRLINRRSTTYKQLDDSQRAALDGDAAVSALRQHPTLIKRPVLEWQHILLVGFSEQNTRRFLMFESMFEWIFEEENE